MTTSLQSKLTELAQAFAGSVLAAVRSVSLDELLAGTHRGARSETHVGNGANAPVEEAAPKRPARARAASPTGRLPRRSADDIAAALDQVVALVKKHREGLEGRANPDRASNAGEGDAARLEGGSREEEAQGQGPEASDDVHGRLIRSRALPG